MSTIVLLFFWSGPDGIEAVENRRPNLPQWGWKIIRLVWNRHAICRRSAQDVRHSTSVLRDRVLYDLLPEYRMFSLGPFAASAAEMRYGKIA